MIIDDEGLSSERVLNLSQELDKLIVKYYKEDKYSYNYFFKFLFYMPPITGGFILFNQVLIKIILIGYFNYRQFLNFYSLSFLIRIIGLHLDGRALFFCLLIKVY